MGKASRSKGNRNELALAKLLGGQRIPLSGAAGGQFTGDVLLPNGQKIECKVRADGFKQIYDWLDGGADYLALRADRKGWIVCMDLEHFQELLHGRDQD